MAQNDLAGTAEIGALAKAGHLATNHDLAGACSVGSTFAIESTAYPKSAGCYTDVNGGAQEAGYMYAQTETAPTDDGEGFEQGLMAALAFALDSSSSLSQAESSEALVRAILSKFITLLERVPGD